ncbi:Uncharacterised protein [Klebsiella michiganensis]|uniref:Uncharacterized protein n=1 Tax=Klebsiella michiganensis TaxID=1134687 RepID=A0A7H4N340_9ENTR|nr:Uncharacterised protein [Klebsiella michiganensis]
MVNGFIFYPVLCLNLLFLALLRKVLGLMLFATPVNIGVGKVKTRLRSRELYICDEGLSYRTTWVRQTNGNTSISNSRCQRVQLLRVVLLRHRFFSVAQRLARRVVQTRN